MGKMKMINQVNFLLTHRLLKPIPKTLEYDAYPIILNYITEFILNAFVIWNLLSINFEIK